MLTLTKFNRRFTVRKLQQYGDPTIHQLEKLELPRGSVLHHIDMDVTSLAPPKTLSYLQNIEKYAQVRHHAALPEVGTQGRPTPVKVNQDRDILTYHRLNPTLKRMRDDKLVQRDQKVLLIENYTPMLQRYRYPEGTLLAWYDRIYNVMLTMRNQLLSNADAYSRQNYVILNIGNELPSFNKFLAAQSTRSDSKLNKFQSLTQLWLLEIFTWLGTKRDSSILSGMTPDQARRVNFILTYENGFISLNLGELDGWSVTNDTGNVPEDQMQRRLYKTVRALMSEPVDIVEDAALSPEGNTVDLERENIEAELDMQNDKEDIQEEIVSFDKEEFAKDEDVVIVKEEEKNPNELVIEEVIDHKSVILKECAKLADAGRISVKANQFLTEAAENFVNLPDPYGSDLPYGEAMKVTEEDVKVEPKKLLEDDTILEESWSENVTDAINEKYREKVMKKDVLGAVASAQRMGLVVHNHSIEKEITATGAVEHHRLKVQPVGGDPVPVYFSIPVIDDDGCWTTNGVKYTMRRQRVDVPIRKVDPETVALTTFYGKNFVSRSDKAVNDKPKWLTNQIVALGLDLKDTTVTDVKMSNVFDPSSPAPKAYTSVAKRIEGFKSKGYVWHFDINATDEHFGNGDDMNVLRKKKMVPIAKGRNDMLVMSETSVIYKYKDKDNIDFMGTIEEVLGIDTTKAPKELSELSILGKSLSLGFIFSYYLGMEGMFKHFGMRYSRLAANERIEKEDYDLIIRLSDAKFAVSVDTYEQLLVLNGLAKYVKHLTNYTESEVNREDIYLNLLMEEKLTARFLTELAQMRNSFVDDMHARVLRKMKEPETFMGLLKRANEMLIDDMSKPEINGEEMMFLGHQRIAGHVYTGISRAMRNYNNQPPGSRKFELTNSMIWGEINQDPSVLQAQEANPIQAIKESDVITMGGTGGRNKKTMVKRTRGYPEDDLGVVSGDTVDSSDVGVTSFLSANPQLDSVDGIPAKRDLKKQKIGSLMSFCVSLAPDSLIDDDKRWNFVNIQLGSATASEHYKTTPYRTGSEKLAAHRTSSKHASVATQDGKVTDVTEDSIVVKYADKTEVEYPLGRWFGSHEGATYPHDMATTFKKGDTFKARDVLAYNAKHFEPDVISPRQVNWKNGVLATIALIEGEPTFEDSNTISPELSAKLVSETTKVKEVAIKFDQLVTEMAKVKDKVGVDSILCTFADDVTGGTGTFTDEAAATLRKVSSHSPRAKVKGHIDKIEVVYHGDIEDMSESVAEIVKRADRQRKKEAKAANGKIAETGSVDGSYRIEGVPLAYNEIAIRFYISHMSPMVGGDKGVVANQMKTTVQDLMVGKNEAEDGTPMDGYFGRNGIEGRIVGSIYQIGTTNPICIESGRRGLAILNGESVIPYK
tara:strand:- start:7201 stop:11352 length:4152 start_codon:yes stop_codon:yes gene_type:complete